MVSNLASTKVGESAIHDGYKQAVAFTTGSNSGGYVLKSVTVPLKNKDGSGRNLTLKLHAMEGSGQYSTTSQPSSTALGDPLRDSSHRQHMDQHHLHLPGKR